MALIEYVDEELASDSVVRELNSTVKRNVARMLANSGPGFLGSRRLGHALMVEAALGAELRELAILSAARTLGCAYVWGEHTKIAAALGVGADKIHAVQEGTGAPALAELERRVVDFAADVTLNVKGDRALVEALTGDLGRDEIVELMLVIGYYGTISRIVETLEVDPEPI